MRSVYLHKDKAIFKVEELPADRFAESLGLPGTPKIKFLNKELAKKKNASRTVTAIQAEILKEQDARASESDAEEADESFGSEDEAAVPADSAQPTNQPVASGSKV